VALGARRSPTSCHLPAYFGTDEREATSNAGAGGPERPRDPQRADAAAIAYAWSKGKTRPSGLRPGGGTFDITMIEIKES